MWREWSGSVPASISGGTQPPAALMTFLLKGLLELVVHKYLCSQLKGFFLTINRFGRNAEFNATHSFLQQLQQILLL